MSRGRSRADSRTRGDQATRIALAEETRNGASDAPLSSHLAKGGNLLSDSS